MKVIKGTELYLNPGAEAVAPAPRCHIYVMVDGPCLRHGRRSNANGIREIPYSREFEIGDTATDPSRNPSALDATIHPVSAGIVS